MIPLMNKMGYNRDFNAAISITAATTGLLIPPSNVMIVYSLATGGLSIAAIFIAGVLPGILVGLSLMIVAGILSAKHKYGKEEAYKFNEILIRAIGTFACLIVPVSLLVFRKRYLIGEQQLKILTEDAALKASLAGVNRIFLVSAGILLAAIITVNIILKLRGVQPEKKTVVTGLACFLFPFVWFLKGCFTAAKLQGNSLAVMNGIIAGYVLVLIAAIIIYGVKVSWKGFVCFVQAIPALMLVIIVLGGILSGVFTATEASAIAVVYAFFLSVFIYKEVKFSDLSKIVLQSAITTAVVMLLIATSMAMSWVLAFENVPQSVSAFLLGLTSNKIILLLIINMMLLVVGTFMDMTPAVLIFTPIFLPIVKGFGMDPLHFGIILIMNLCIGLCTPPVGTCLFVGCGIAETTVTKVMRHIIPCFIAMIAVLLICTYIPSISLTLPRLFDLIK
jgi:TRAP-type C4-dicarboxylate transport system permease large subunit